MEGLSAKSHSKEHGGAASRGKGEGIMVQLLMYCSSLPSQAHHTHLHCSEGNDTWDHGPVSAHRPPRDTQAPWPTYLASILHGLLGPGS
jgi:hypothetical protein